MDIPQLEGYTFVPDEIPSGVDPQLLAEMQRGDLPKNIKPSKGNNQDSRNALAILQAELSRQEGGDPHSALVEPTDLPLNAKKQSKPTPTTDWEGYTFVPDTPQKTPSLEGYTFVPDEVTHEIDPSKGPGYLKSIGQGVADIGGEVGRAGMLAAGGLAGLVDTDAADATFKAADEFRQGASHLVMSEEERKNQGFGEKLAGAIAGGGAIAVSAVVAAPATLAVLGASTLLNTSTDMIKRGVDLQRASTIGLIDATFSTVGNVVPIIGKTVGRSMTLGALTNPLIGGATDLAVSRMLNDRPDIQADYNPFNLERRLLEAGQGAAQGYGFYKYAKHREKIQKEKRDAADAILDKGMVTDILPTLDKEIPGKRPVYQEHEGMTKAESLRDLIDNGDPTAPAPMEVDGVPFGRAKGKLTQALDLISGDTEAGPTQRLLASGLQRLFTRLGLDHVTVEKLPSESKVPGKYNPEKDIIGIRSENIDHQGYVRTVLHEAVHAITHKAVGIWRRAGLDPEFRKTLDPHSLELIEKMDKLNTVFEIARGKILEQHGNQHIIDPTARDTYFKGLTTQGLESSKMHQVGSPEWERVRTKLSENYGFDNVHEFMSEILASPKEISATLSKLKIKSEEVPFLKSTSPNRVISLWQAVRAAYKNLIGMPSDNMLYDIAFDHVTGLIEHQTAATRFEGLTHPTIASNSKGLSNVLLRRIAGLVQNVSSKEELATRLSIQSESKVWQDWVGANIDRIWDHSHDIIDKVGKSNFKDLPEALQKLTGDDRTLDQFIGEDFAAFVDKGKVHKLLIEADDLNKTGRQLFSPSVLSMMKDGFGGKILRFVNHKAVEYKSMGDILFEKANQHFSQFNNLEQKRQLAMMDTIASHDKPTMQKMLRDKGLQWLTDDMLREKGHNDAEIEAYKGLTKGSDMLWSLMNQALVKEGKAPVPQIPGYMPHVFPGAYKVLVKKILPQPEGMMGTPQEFTVMVKGFHLRQSAEKFAKALSEGKHDVGDDVFRPVIDPQTKKPYQARRAENLADSLMSGIQEHVDAYKNGLILDPATLQVLERIEADNMRGFTKHSLERSNISGYTGEHGQSKKLWDRFSPVFNENHKILKLWENYAKNITDYYRNTMFVAEVMSPLTASMPMELNGRTHYHALFKDLPVLNKHLADFGFNFTGKNLNKVPWLDEFMQDHSISLGVDPMLYRNGLRNVRNMLSMIKLRGNPGNYAANALQPMHMLGLLEMAKVIRGREGVKAPDSIKSMAKALAGFTDADLEAAKSWARHNKHLDAQLEYELHDKNLAPLKNFINTITGGRINPTIETIGREMSFTMAYLHMRQVYPDNPMRAREAATNLMKMTMIDYDTTQRPLMYQNYGSAGEAISPFAVFRNGYIGNTMLMMKMVAQNPTKLASYKPLIATQLNFLVSAGVLGMIGASEYNLIARQLQAIAPEWEVPTLEELLFKMHAPDWVTFGMVSAGTKSIPGMDKGVYIGSSLNAVGTDDAFAAALVPFVGALADAVGYGSKFLVSLASEDTIPPSAASMYKAQKQLTPGILQPWVDRSVYMHPESEVAPQTSSLEGGVERTPGDWASYYVGGRRSLGETIESTQNRLIAKAEQSNKKSVKNLVELGVDRAMGIGSSLSLEELQRRAAVYGMGPDEYNKAVVRGRENRMLSQKYQEAKKHTLEGLKQQREREEMTNE